MSTLSPEIELTHFAMEYNFIPRATRGHGYMAFSLNYRFFSLRDILTFSPWEEKGGRKRGSIQTTSSGGQQALKFNGAPLYAVMLRRGEEVPSFLMAKRSVVLEIHFRFRNHRTGSKFKVTILLGAKRRSK